MLLHKHPHSTYCSIEKPIVKIGEIVNKGDRIGYSDGDVYAYAFNYKGNPLTLSSQNRPQLRGKTFYDRTPTSKKREVAFGIETKINVAKNHIDGPLGGISMGGKIVSTPHGFIYPDKVENYKKEHVLYFRNLFEDDSITADDLTMKLRDVDANGKIDYSDEIINKAVDLTDIEE